MDEPIPRQDHMSAAEQAFAWLERLKDPQPGDRERFLAWLKDSRANVRETLLAGVWETALQDLDQARRIDVERLLSEARDVLPFEAPPPAQQSYAPTRAFGEADEPIWKRLKPRAFAASLAALAILIAAYALIAFRSPANEYTTGVGEQRTLELADGSVVSLNTRSTVRIALSNATRDIYLTEGQALFSVAHDATRPFRVHVGPAVVQAIGTKFDVRHIGDRTQIVVIEGKVQVMAEEAAGAVQERLATLAETTRLAAGQAVRITPKGITTPEPADVAGVTAWQQRRLKFLYTTLEEVVDEFNRFNRTPHIRIEGAELRARPISGVFEADDPESLISSLASDNTIAVERSAQEFVIRERPIIVHSGPEP